MPLFDITRVRDDSVVSKESLVRLNRTTFAEQGIHERAHLQATLRDHIGLISPDLFVVSEEFGDFEGANRRIDLLCLDRACRLIVVELKRTADGGHMELQALRCAAMVSTMTFSQVVHAHARYRKQRGWDDYSEDGAREALAGWLEPDEEDEPVIAREVGIVLASEDFSQEITTTVLWLNEFHDLDIKCVRLSPYKHDDRLLLDVQQVIPLPEASLYTVRVREKETAARQATRTMNADFTKFVVQTPDATSKPLPKRWAMLALVEGLLRAGVHMDEVSKILPPAKTLHVTGVLRDPDELWRAVQERYAKSDANRRRWHIDNPLVDGDDTWVLNNNWGTRSREFFAILSTLAPGFAVHEEGVVPESLA